MAFNFHARYRWLARRGLSRGVAVSLALWRPLPGVAYVAYDCFTVAAVAAIAAVPFGLLPCLGFGVKHGHWLIPGCLAAGLAAWGWVARQWTCAMANGTDPGPDMTGGWAVASDSDFADLAQCMDEQAWLAYFLYACGRGDADDMRRWRSGDVRWLVGAGAAAGKAAEIKAARASSDARVWHGRLDRLPSMVDAAARVQAVAQARAQAERLACPCIVSGGVPGMRRRG